MKDASHDESTPALDLETRLTAYVLGELDATETAEVERRLAEDAEARREVEAIRAATGQIAAALAVEPAPALTGEQRDAITRGGDAADEDPPVVYSFAHARKLWGGLGLAAAACLAVTLAWPMLRPRGTTEFAIQQDAASEAAPPRAVVSKDARDLSAFTLQNADALSAEPSAPGLTGTTATLEAGAPAEVGLRSVENRVDTAGERADAIQRVIEETQRRQKSGKRRVAERPGASSLASGAGSGGALGVSRAPAKKNELVDRPVGGGDADGRLWANAARRPAPASGLSAADPAAVELERLRDAPRAQPADVSRDAGRRVAPLEDLIERLEEAKEQDEVRALDDDETVAPGQGGGFGREDYARLEDNDFVRPSETPLSTFSIDVDTASYSNVRRFLDSGRLPPKDAVRIEELINYFGYDYEPASGDQPFSVNVETNACPWNDAHRLVRVGLRGREIDRDMRPATNLVFLIDVSGSMNDRDKLPLLKQSLQMLVEHLTADDRIAIVVYAGAAGLVLPPTYCDERETILAALDALGASGSTNGGAGIELAYGTAQEAFIAGGVNRVILCTDGDFNVGVTGGDLIRLIEAKRETGVFLSVLGFGRGNLQDARMEELSNKGNGNFAYIDSADEAHRVFVERMAGTLVTIAKDVKIQVEFNPARVGSYRLIGYANRRMAAQDFRDDRKDAGEIGAGHTVTALYEIAPADGVAFADGEALRYQERTVTDEAAASPELATVMLRYKAPDGDTATEIAYPIVDDGADVTEASVDFRFAAAVASFGMVLRDSPHKGASSFDGVLQLARAGEVARSVLGGNAQGEKADKNETDDRAAFIMLVERARVLTEDAAAAEAERE